MDRATWRRILEKALLIKRTCTTYRLSEKQEIMAMIDDGTQVTLVDCMTAVQLDLAKVDSELPRLGWINREGQALNRAYLVTLELTDDGDETWKFEVVAYDTVMTDIDVLIGSHMLEKLAVQVDCQLHTWRYGIDHDLQVELVTAEELIKDLEVDLTQSPMLIGHVGIETDDLIEICTLAADISWMKFIPTELEHFQDIFDRENASKLPDLKETDHTIAIMDDKVPPHSLLYRLSEKELRVLCEYLEDALDKGWIQYSTSPAGAPVMFVLKKNRKLWLCVDYRALNSITVKDRCLLPLIDKTLDQLWDATYFTKLDLKDTYH